MKRNFELSFAGNHAVDVSFTALFGPLFFDEKSQVTIPSAFPWYSKTMGANNAYGISLGAAPVPISAALAPRNVKNVNFQHLRVGGVCDMGLGGVPFL